MNRRNALALMLSFPVVAVADGKPSEYVKDPNYVAKATVHQGGYIIHHSLGKYFYDFDSNGLSATPSIDKNGQRLTIPWRAVCYATIEGVHDVKVVEFDVQEQ